MMDDDDNTHETAGGVMVRDTEVLDGNLYHCRFVHHKSHMTSPGLESEQPPWE
jgi:hypothetical protein